MNKKLKDFKSYMLRQGAEEVSDLYDSVNSKANAFFFKTDKSLYDFISKYKNKGDVIVSTNKRSNLYKAYIKDAKDIFSDDMEERIFIDNLKANYNENFEDFNEAKASMNRKLKSFKTYMLKNGARELKDLYAEDGFTGDQYTMFYFQVNDLDELINNYKNKKDITIDMKNKKGNKYRAWYGNASVMIRNLGAEKQFFKSLQNMKPSKVPTFMPGVEILWATFFNITF